MSVYLYDTYFMDRWTHAANQKKRDRLCDAEAGMFRYSDLSLGLSESFCQNNKDVLESFGKDRVKCFPHHEKRDDGRCFETYGKALNALIRAVPKEKTYAFVWSAYKYEALGKSEALYRAIRKALNSNKIRNADDFNQYLNKIKKLPFERGQSVNMFTHVYGHFKKHVTVEQKQAFLFLLDAYAEGNASFETVLKRLMAFQNTYVDRFLHRSTLFRVYGNNLISM